jgi:hypothetical protein
MENPVQEVVKTPREWDSELKRLALEAEAELCLDALPSKPANPFAGASERLRALEDERLQAERRVRGDALAKALEAFNAVNEEISQLGVEHRQTQRKIGELKADETVSRWLRAPGLARNMGLPSAWGAFAAFLASGAPPAARPICVGEVYIAQFPELLRFEECDRAVIREYAAAENRAKQVSWAFTIVMKRREKLMQDFPALRSLPQPV